VTDEEAQEASNELTNATWSLLELPQTDIVSLALAQVVALHIANQPPEQRNGVRNGIVEVIDKFVLAIESEL
jgi:hypothetical protein